MGIGIRNMDIWDPNSKQWFFFQVSTLGYTTLSIKNITPQASKHPSASPVHARTEMSGYAPMIGLIVALSTY
jgi:hypothetical protein